MSFKEWESVFHDVAGEIQEDYGGSWTIEFDDSILPDNPAQNWFQYIRGAFARFQCSKCKKTWPSKRVLVVFHFCLMENKGTVKVRRFRQECKKCTKAKMEEPHFSRDNIEVLLEKLMEKIRIKIYKEVVGEVNKEFTTDRRSEGPHESSLCEACRHGVCRKSEIRNQSSEPFNNSFFFF